MQAGVSLNLELVHELIEPEGIDARPKGALEGIRLEDLRSARPESLSGEAAPECFVDHLPEGLAPLVGNVLELFSEIVVESDRGAHLDILMPTQSDVNVRLARRVR
jgi:hypothetical protein